MPGRKFGAAKSESGLYNIGAVAGVAFGDGIFNKMNGTSAGDTGYQRDTAGGVSFGIDTRE